MSTRSVLALHQGEAQGFQRRRGSGQGNHLLAAFCTILGDGDHCDAEVHGDFFLSLALDFATAV